MQQPSPPEAWLRGPLSGIDAVLMPAAHALVQARDDITGALVNAQAEELWATPGGAASPGFHLRHLAGSLDRLLTYARGERLSPGQLAVLAREGDPGATGQELERVVLAAIDRALEQLRRTPPSTLGDIRPVGRAGLPATVLGLLIHTAEHASRHTGQFLTTLRIVRGLAPMPAA
jgi:hypothetical protein